MRAKRSNATTISAAFTDVTDESYVAADGDVTFAVYDDALPTLATVHSATGVAVGTSPNVSYTTDLPASVLSQYRNLRVVVTAVVGGLEASQEFYIKVVSDRFFTLADLRRMSGLDDTDMFSTSLLAAARDVSEDFIEDFTETAWVKQARSEVYDGLDGIHHQRGKSILFVERVPARELISVEIDGTVRDTSSWSISESGRIIAPSVSSTLAGQNMTISYVFGHNAPKDDLRLASMKLARHIVLSDESTIPDRARMMQTEWGLFHLDVASMERPTGLPEVDAVLMRYRFEQPITIV